MESASCVLQSVSIDRLFGRSSFKFHLSPDVPAVLTGSNGTGKSTVLRLIKALSKGDVRALTSAPVKSIRLDFSNAEPFILSRTGTNETKVQWGSESAFLQSIDFGDRLQDWARDALVSAGPDDDLLQVLRVAASENEVSSNEFTMARLRVRRIIDGADENSVPSFLGEFTKRFGCVLVEDQRLIDIRRSATEQSSPGGRKQAAGKQLAIERASDQIARLIRQADSSYARASQDQDRKFPEELIAALRSGRPTSPDDLERLVLEVSSRREDLKSVGLLDSDSSVESTFLDEKIGNYEVARVMESFLVSTIKKFAVLEDLEKRLSAFKTFLDSRFPSKTLTLDRADGFIFDSVAGVRLKPSQLSSGEQQLVILAYEILFRTRPGTLVLIDEPEISLHILWQDNLIDDLVKMGHIQSLQFLMATHSPALLANHPELEFSLDDTGRDRLWL